jgi:hypothetical protein
MRAMLVEYNRKTARHQVHLEARRIHYQLTEKLYRQRRIIRRRVGVINYSNLYLCAFFLLLTKVTNDYKSNGVAMVVVEVVRLIARIIRV